MEISYTRVKVPEGGIKLSPSQLTLFYRSGKEWLNGMENRSSFTGNKATVQGTVVHFILEQQAIGGDIEEVDKAIADYLERECDAAVITDAEYNEIKEFKDKYQDELRAWLDADKDKHSILDVEPSLHAIAPTFFKGQRDYYLAGSIDAVVSKVGDADSIVIRDYKTSKRKVSSITNYLIQLMAYKHIYESVTGKKVTGFQIVNIYELKAGLQVNIVNYKPTEEDNKLFKSILKDISQAHSVYLNHPQLKDTLFRAGVDFTGRLEIQQPTKGR